MKLSLITLAMSTSLAVAAPTMNQRGYASHGLEYKNDDASLSGAKRGDASGYALENRNDDALLHGVKRGIASDGLEDRNDDASLHGAKRGIASDGLEDKRALTALTSDENTAGVEKRALTALTDEEKRASTSLKEE